MEDQLHIMGTNIDVMVRNVALFLIILTASFGKPVNVRYGYPWGNLRSLPGSRVTIFCVLAVLTLRQNTHSGYFSYYLVICDFF
jgi:hypothetical protein